MSPFRQRLKEIPTEEYLAELRMILRKGGSRTRRKRSGRTHGDDDLARLPAPPNLEDSKSSLS